MSKMLSARLMRRSVLGDQGTYEMDKDDDAKSTKSERVRVKGRKKSRTSSMPRPTEAGGLAQRDRRVPVRRASLGALQTAPNLAVRRSTVVESATRRSTVVESIARSTVDSSGKIRRVPRKPKGSGDEASDDGSKRSRKSKKSVGSRKSVRSKSRRSVMAGSTNDDDNNSRRSVIRKERIAETKLLAIEAAKEDDELQQKVEALQAKIVELKQEQLVAQTESMKLNKEKRDLKLELQRSQTVVRELRADIREKDLTVKEATDKMEALEKAVESQLDKVEDLEDELKRANDEIFTLEDKLNQMQLQLVESEAVGEDGKANEESDFEAKRRERQERRLKEKEKELEERERRLQKLQADAPTRNSVVGGAAANKQLEQDNRILLKSLNREKENSAAKIKAKEEEIARLNEKVKKFMEEKGGDYNHQIMEENRILAEQLDEEKECHADTIKIKDEKISKLETDLRELRLNGSRSIPAETDAYKKEAADLRQKLETAEQRNSLLEDEIENWKNRNIALENELTELKEKISKYRSEANNASTSSTLNMSSNLNNSISYLQDDASDDDSSRRGIGKLWNRVTTMSRRDILSSPKPGSPRHERRKIRNAEDIVSRSTFH